MYLQRLLISLKQLIFSSVTVFSQINLGLFRKLKVQGQHIVEHIPLANRILKDDQTMHLYLKGKILDFISGSKHNQEAEDCLTKALELNGKMADAWLCLGNCVWKRKAHEKARKCFQSGLDQDPQNKELKRQLSSVERILSRANIEVENRSEMISDSIKHAKEAISLDNKDGISWYVLGNAYLTAFLVSGGWDGNMLMQSEQAYQNSVSDKKIQFSPEMCVYRALVFKFLEKYPMALERFKEAGSRPDGLKKQSRLCEVLNKIKSLLEDLNEAKRLPSPTSSLPTVESLASALASVHLDPSYERVTLDSLTAGRNKGKAVIGKVLFSVQNPDKIPLYYVVCDSEQTCFVITVYGLRRTAIKVEDQVTLLDPFCLFADFEWEQKKYQFKSVRVDSLKLLRVNGALVLPEHVKNRSMYAQLAEA